MKYQLIILSYIKLLTFLTKRFQDLGDVFPIKKKSHVHRVFFNRVVIVVKFHAKHGLPAVGKVPKFVNSLF